MEWEKKISPSQLNKPRYEKKKRKIITVRKYKNKMLEMKFISKRNINQIYSLLHYNKYKTRF